MNNADANDMTKPGELQTLTLYGFGNRLCGSYL